MATNVEAFYPRTGGRTRSWNRTQEEPAAWSEELQLPSIATAGLWRPPRKLRHVVEGRLIENRRAIEEEIARSAAILTLTDDWDDEGSPGYHETTWKRAVGFLRTQVALAERLQTLLRVPQINPANKGSIDLFWPSHNGRWLLVNFPADPDELATYYGKDDTGDTTAGTIGTEADRPDLVAWLIED